MVEPGTQDLIFLKSARSWNRASNTRCGETDSLNRVLGASDGLLPSATLFTRPPTSLTGRPNKPRNSFGALDATTLPARIGCSAALTAVRDSKSAVDGRAAGRHGCSGPGGRGASAARSCSAAII